MNFGFDVWLAWTPGFPGTRMGSNVQHWILSVTPGSSPLIYKQIFWKKTHNIHVSCTCGTTSIAVLVLASRKGVCGKILSSLPKSAISGSWRLSQLFSCFQTTQWTKFLSLNPLTKVMFYSLACRKPVKLLSYCVLQ